MFVPALKKYIVQYGIQYLLSSFFLLMIDFFSGIYTFLVFTVNYLKPEKGTLKLFINTFQIHFKQVI